MSSAVCYMYVCRMPAKWQLWPCTTTGPLSVTEHWQSAAMTGGQCPQWRANSTAVWLEGWQPSWGGASGRKLTCSLQQLKGPKWSLLLLWVCEAFYFTQLCITRLGSVWLSSSPCRSPFYALCSVYVRTYMRVYVEKVRTLVRTYTYMCIQAITLHTYVTTNI